MPGRDCGCRQGSLYPRLIMVSPPTQPPTAQVPWTPTAHAFAQHQFSQVTNFWKQGRQATFRLEALPGGQAELNLTFQLPSASEVIPPPFHVPTVPAPQRPILPLFPKSCFPQGFGPDSKAKLASQKKLSQKQRKSYRRSVLHRATLAAPSLPPPKQGSLRHAALACVQRQHVDISSIRKRAPPCSPSNQSPLSIGCAQIFKLVIVRMNLQRRSCSGATFPLRTSPRQQFLLPM